MANKLIIRDYEGKGERFKYELVFRGKVYPCNEEGFMEKFKLIVEGLEEDVELDIQTPKLEGMFDLTVNIKGGVTEFN